ncbi:hypothetical protein [Bartonella sp. HY406]|uniref:hypothetical protein n=1 Tax=Bartonella sp. HY406 TaxID=2979331 RepID=UPI0021C996A9|nr:hypothetical protein [Bartonella sp. HY406]UXN03650.1 hypothetical protein N6B01_00965 [Bartonella sp. HY406]
MVIKWNRLLILAILSYLLSTFQVMAQGAPNYVPGTRLEGEYQSFGKWQFTVTSLTRDETSIHPQTNTVEVCLKKGMDQAAIPFTPKPLKGRCVLRGNRFAADNIDINYICDEGQDIYSHLSFSLDHKGDGIYEGPLNYGVAPQDLAYQLHSVAYVTAKRMSDCEE